MSDLMLFHGKTGDALLSLQEAIKEGSTKFDNPVDAHKHVVKNQLIPDHVDNKCTAYYKASSLGVDIDLDGGSKKSKAKKNDAKQEDKSESK